MQGGDVWGQTGIPYVIDNGGLIVRGGAALTISPAWL